MGNFPRQADKSALRLRQLSSPTIANWKDPQSFAHAPDKTNVSIYMGWGKLLFAHTFANPMELIEALCDETSYHRNVAFYVPDPHVLLSLRPQDIFLDPSHTYRLWLHNYKPKPNSFSSEFRIRKIHSKEDVGIINTILKKNHMMTLQLDNVWDVRHQRSHSYFVLENLSDNQIIGTVTGVNHQKAFGDPEAGSSFWNLAIDPDTATSGAGEYIVRHLAEHYIARGCNYLDLSVMHHNTAAINLYLKLGFERVPVFLVKTKNKFNETLYSVQKRNLNLNPYAQIIVDEANRRGIRVDIIDAPKALFTLSFGGIEIRCHESLTDITPAVSVKLCAEKDLTMAILKKHDIRVPQQLLLTDSISAQQQEEFVQTHKRVVVKPANGEQGKGISVDLRSVEQVTEAIKEAKKIDHRVLVEEFVSGYDVRIIVINYKFVAAAVRKPPEVVGNGNDTLEKLIQKYNRRRMRATGGESEVPFDDQMHECLSEQGYALSDVIERDKTVLVRKAANVHSGGTITDISQQISPSIRFIAEQASQALNIPVVGLDFLMPDIAGTEYVIIEANERPGLANHEPAPVVERFVDLLFPSTAKEL